MPSARATSYELIPFLSLVIIQTAGSHLSKPSGESAKIVPFLTENCWHGCLARHFQRRWFARYIGSPLPQMGHFTPCGHRSATRNAWQVSWSAKYRMASVSVPGAAVCLSMP
jgi:hypothetical protein